MKATASHKMNDASEPLSAGATFIPASNVPAAASINLLVIGAAAICVLTFLLGITTALLWSGGQRQASIAAVPIQAEPSTPASAAESLDEAVTRAVAPDLLNLSGKGASNPVVADLAAAVLEGLQPKRTVGKLTDDELAVKAAEATMILNNNKLRMLREGVLAGVYTIDTVDENGVKRVKLRTINAQMTSELVGSMLMQAAEEGRIELPASLKTSDGNLDLDTLMFNMVQMSLANDGTPEGAEAAREMSRKIFAASTVQSREVGGKRTYVVDPGDSLAYIALQFYGKPSAFQRIFDANRDTLQSPEKIQIGQRLIIPS